MARRSSVIGSLAARTDPHGRPDVRRVEPSQRIMQLGVHIGYWGLWLSAADQLQVVRDAEEFGYHSAWSAEAYGSDAATVLAWLAGQTERIRLGAAVFQIPGRTPAMTAMTAATLDVISGGRFMLGLGASGPQVAEGWHGQPFAQQLQRTREYVEIVRLALTRERLSYDGELYTLPLPDGPGKSLKLTIAPVQERLPIYIAAIGPNNTRLTAEIADGWIPTMISPEHMDQFLPHLEGAREGFDIAPQVSVSINDDLAAARDHMRGVLALYVGGMGSRKKNFYNRLVSSYGFEENARKVQDLYLAGDKTGAMAALSDELIDATTLCGPYDRVRERLKVYREAGVGTLIASVAGGSAAERREQLRLLAEAAA